jgi:hypothetical protein
MPYIQRNASGLITSLHRQAEPQAQEFLADQHAEVLAFFGQREGVGEGAGFDRLDADFVRVIEDVIDALIVKNVINITDLPAEAQVKLFARKTFRERISKSSLRLFEPTDFGDVI